MCVPNASDGCHYFVFPVNYFHSRVPAFHLPQSSQGRWNTVLPSRRTHRVTKTSNDSWSRL